MLDLTKKITKKQPKTITEADSRAELKDLASQLEGNLNDEIDDVRSRSKTVKSDHLDKVSGSIFDFLLEPKYHMDFLELLRLNQTLSDPDNKTSKKTLLSQKRFLELVKGLSPNEMKLQESTQSSFYKWLSRNGLGTKEQITNYYKSRSKEVANQEKRSIMIEDMIEELGKNPALIKKLFSYPEVQREMRRILE